MYPPVLFGHTLWHAIEQVRGYGTQLHGEAVAAGMAFAAEVSRVTGRLDRDEARRLTALLSRLGLPESWVCEGAEISWDDVREVSSFFLRSEKLSLHA